MEKQAKKRKSSMLMKRFFRIPLGWQIVSVLLIAVGIFATIRFVVGFVEDLYDDVTSDNYYVSEEMGDYEVHSYYGESDRIVKHGRLFAVLKGLDDVSVGDSDTLWLVKKDEKYAFFNTQTGKLMSNFIYHKAWGYSEGVAAVVDEDFRLKFIDSQGNLAIERTFSYNKKNECEFEFHHRMCPALDSLGKVGMIDLSGKWIIAPNYDSAVYADGYWTLQKDDSLVVIDSTGHTIIDMAPGHGLKITEEGDLEVWHRWLPGRLYDTTGKLLAHQTYWLIKKMTYYEDGEELTANVLEYYTEYGQCGLLSSDGRILTEARYDEIDALDKKLFKASYNLGSEDDYTTIYVLLNEKGELVESH